VQADSAARAALKSRRFRRRGLLRGIPPESGGGSWWMETGGVARENRRETNEEYLLRYSQNAGKLRNLSVGFQASPMNF